MFFEILIASALPFNSKTAENALFQAFSTAFLYVEAAFSLLTNVYSVRVKKHSPKLKKCIFRLRRTKKFKRIILASIDFVGANKLKSFHIFFAYQCFFAHRQQANHTAAPYIRSGLLFFLQQYPCALKLHL